MHFPDITPRIRAVFNDGPGFSQAVLDTPGYRTALPLVELFSLSPPVVGMLLGHEESYTIVQSGLKGLMQHDPIPGKSGTETSFG
ncbi:MAG: Mbeg1-like protein [Eisenbergiella sp.]